MSSFDSPRQTAPYDLWFALVLAIMTFAVAAFMAPRGYQAGFVDMAHDGYQLQQAVDLSGGAVLFRDSFDQYGPLGGYVNAAAFKALGGRLLSLKYFICGLYAVIAILLYAIARFWLASLLAAFAVGIWLGLAPFYQHGIMISPHVHVLLLQAAIVAVLLYAAPLTMRCLFLVGALAGLAWGMKQSMGSLLLASIVSALAVTEWRSGVRAVLARSSAVAAGFGAVVAVVLTWMWSVGALHDWYLQTIAFPREFYFSRYASILPGDTRSLWNQYQSLAGEFIRLQLGQSPAWLVIRGSVFVAAVASLRGAAPRSWIVVASMTAFLWLGAFPSANFMHQWWTAGMAIPVFVAAVRGAAARLTSAEPVRFAAAVAIVLAICAGDLLDRKRATSFRAAALNQTIEVPPLLRGIRTDIQTKRAFAALYAALANYRAHHPDAKLVEIGGTAGAWSTVNESLLFLTALERNTHFDPLYWNMPVLTTTTYAAHDAELWTHIRATRPLLIDHRDGAVKTVEIPGYSLLALVESDFGHWYLYAPDDPNPQQHGESATLLARDGSTAVGAASRSGDPATGALSTSAVGAARGVTASPASRTLYTWPADLPLAAFEGDVEPPTPISHNDHIIRPIASDGWQADGVAKGRFDGLVEFGEYTRAAGDVLIVRGSVEEGGLQVGFLQEDAWTGFVTVTTPGPFEAFLQIQRPGRYRLSLANCIETTRWEVIRRHGVKATLGVLTGGYMPNRFQVTTLGWLRPRAASVDRE